MRTKLLLAPTILLTSWAGPSAVAQLGWTEVVTRDAPAPRFGHTMVRNHPSFHPLLFGGTDGAVSFGDTWLFDGDDWTLTATTGPAPRHDHAMAMLHYSDDSMILFGGRDANGGLLGDTWAWDGASWSPIGTAVAPSPRAGHSLARDEFEEKEFVLFGGRTASGVSDETWRFAGGQWRRVEASVRPPAREGHSMIMVNDSLQFLLFGGHDGATVFDDVWSFDGASWHRVGTLPGPRTNQSPVFQGLWRQRLLTFGGSDGAALSETIERSAAGEWLDHATVGAPSARDEAALALGWHGGHSRTVLFGGRDSAGAALGDTWMVEPLTIPTVESFGQGCGPGAWSKDGGADLFLQAHTALLGNTLSLTAYTSLPGRAVFLVGKELAKPIGCGPLVAPTLVMPAPVESLFAGLASGTVGLEIPFEPSLVGAEVAMQVIVEIGTTTKRSSVSRGVRVTVAE